MRKGGGLGGGSSKGHLGYTIIVFALEYCRCGTVKAVSSVQYFHAVLSVQHLQCSTDNEVSSVKYYQCGI